MKLLMRLKDIGSNTLTTNKLRLNIHERIKQ